MALLMAAKRTPLVFASVKELLVQADEITITPTVLQKSIFTEQMFHQLHVSFYTKVSIRVLDILSVNASAFFSHYVLKIK